MSASLLDDSSEPPFRAAVGALMAEARRCDFAVQHVRLADIDLTAGELARVRCRLLLGRFDADLLASLRSSDAAHRRLAVLADFIDSGRLEVRAAGLVRWYPDFSIHYRRHDSVALLGTHNLGRVSAPSSSLFTAALTGASVVRLARHFRVLWRRGYDVREVIRTELHPGVRSGAPRAHAL